MVETEAKTEKEIWKKFLKRHWRMTILIIIGISVAIICALLVYLWVVDFTQAKGIVPSVFGNWTVGYLIGFILRVILWEILLIGIPVIAVAVAIFFLWWKKLPEEEKEEYKREPKKKGPRQKTKIGGGGGFLSFLVFITWLIIVYVDGMWNVTFAAWTFDQLVYSILAALLWDLLIFGVPILILVVLWIRYELKKEP